MDRALSNKLRKNLQMDFSGVESCMICVFIQNIRSERIGVRGAKMKKVSNGIILAVMIAAVLLSCFGMSSCGGQAETLSSPQNLRMEGKVLVWDEVEGATEYLLYLNNEEEGRTEQTSYDLSYLFAPDAYKIELIACGDGKYYLDSESAKLTYKAEVPVESGSDEQGFSYTRLMDKTGYQLSRGTADLSGEVVLPSYYKGLPVKEIAGGAFYYATQGLSGHPFIEFMCNSKTTSIRLPERLEKIGSYAFACMIGIEEVVIPESVTEMGGYAFYGCKNLKRVQFSSNLKEIPAYAFSLCGLEEIVLPEGVESIGERAFCAVDDSKKVDTENNLYTEQNVSEITFPQSLKSIGNRAFLSNRKLKEITLPEGLEVIHGRAFDDTAWYNGHADGVLYLNSVVMGYKGEMPEETEIVIPKKAYVSDGKGGYVSQEVKYIASRAFHKQANLASVSIPDGVTFLGGSAFSICQNLKKVRLPADLIVIPELVFNECREITEITIPDGVIEIGEGAFMNMWKLSNVTLPSELKILGNSAFSMGRSLKEIILPRSLEQFGITPFRSSLALESVYYEGSAERLWELVSQHSENFKFLPFGEATVYTYSEQKPEKEGNYWRYVDGKPVIWE